MTTDFIGKRVVLPSVNRCNVGKVAGVSRGPGPGRLSVTIQDAEGRLRPAVRMTTAHLTECVRVADWVHVLEQVEAIREDPDADPMERMRAYKCWAKLESMSVFRGDDMRAFRDRIDALEEWLGDGP